MAKTRPDRVPRAPRYALSFLPDVAGDLIALSEIDPALVDAAWAVVDDLAFGRATGKLLGKRHLSGDLTGLARLRFDLPGVRPYRFRVVFRIIDNDTVAEVIAIGERADHAIYRTTLSRVGTD